MSTCVNMYKGVYISMYRFDYKCKNQQKGVLVESTVLVEMCGHNRVEFERWMYLLTF